MKKLLLICFTFLQFFCLYPQPYQKLVVEGNKWNYIEEAFTTSGAGEARTHSYYILNDTLIDNVLYKKLMCKTLKYNGSELECIGGLREVDSAQTVFLKKNGEKKEKNSILSTVR